MRLTVHHARHLEKVVQVGGERVLGRRREGSIKRGEHAKTLENEFGATRFQHHRANAELQLRNEDGVAHLAGWFHDPSEPRLAHVPRALEGAIAEAVERVHGNILTTRYARIRDEVHLVQERKGCEEVRAVHVPEGWADVNQRGYVTSGDIKHGENIAAHVNVGEDLIGEHPTQSHRLRPDERVGWIVGQRLDLAADDESLPAVVAEIADAANGALRAGPISQLLARIARAKTGLAIAIAVHRTSSTVNDSATAAWFSAGGAPVLLAAQRAAQSSVKDIAFTLSRCGIALGIGGLSQTVDVGAVARRPFVRGCAKAPARPGLAFFAGAVARAHSAVLERRGTTS